MTLLNKISKELKETDWINDLIKFSNGSIYLVGGIVRDSFLNKPNKDVDLLIEGLTLAEIIKILEKHGKVDIVGQSFSVIKFMPLGYKGEPYDIAIPRKDIKIGDGHKGFKIETENVTILEDLKRRDFTINSIAYNIVKEKIFDPFRGMRDIRKKVLKATDIDAFKDDPLRILRGIQFASRFEFSLSWKTKRLMKEYVNDLNTITGERITGELDKIVNKNGNTKLAFKLMNQIGILNQLTDTLGKIRLKDYKWTNEEHLDRLSFYYVLSQMYSDVSIFHFFRYKLTLDNKTIIAIESLNKLSKDEHDLSFDDYFLMVSNFYTKSPEIKDAMVLSKRAKSIIEQMDNKEIPKNLKSLVINGNDVLNIKPDILKYKIKEVLNKILLLGANKLLNWENRNESLFFLEKILKTY